MELLVGPALFHCPQPILPKGLYIDSPEDFSGVDFAN